MFMYKKPFLSVTEQIALLRSRGMLVEDVDKAREYLQRIGYYRLSAYWHPMRLRDQETDEVRDDFSPGTTFKEATDLYTFDSRLRLIMLDALERIEVSLRADVAITLGARDPKAHRDPRHFEPSFTKQTRKDRATKHSEWLQRLDNRFRDSKDKFAEHFRSKYPGDTMPVWIAVELLDFGPLSHLIAGMKFKDREHIGKNYGGIDPKHIQLGRSPCRSFGMYAHTTPDYGISRLSTSLH